MVTLLLAFAPLMVAYGEIALITRLMKPPAHVRASDAYDVEVSRQRLTASLAQSGMHTEALGEHGHAPIELVCRDRRPWIGGTCLVHALLPGENAPADAADVVRLADLVWRARGVKGVLVASAFSDQARVAARLAPLSVELVNWNDVADGERPGAGPGSS